MGSSAVATARKVPYLPQDDGLLFSQVCGGGRGADWLLLLFLAGPGGRKQTAAGQALSSGLGDRKGDGAASEWCPGARQPGCLFGPLLNRRPVGVDPRGWDTSGGGTAAAGTLPAGETRILLSCTTLSPVANMMAGKSAGAQTGAEKFSPGTPEQCCSQKRLLVGSKPFTLLLPGGAGD